MRRILAIIGAIRAAEAVPFCGVALLGYMLNSQAGGGLSIARLGFALAGTFLLADFAFVFNDLQDMQTDRLSGSKSSRPLVSGLFSPAFSRILSVLLVCAGIVLLAIGTPRQSLLIGLSTVPLSVLYCIRTFPLKTVPVVSSLVHVTQASLVFMLGASCGNRADPAAIWTGLYFGLVFAAGHLHHEVMDAEADRSAGVRTHAVRFGKNTTLRAGFVVWCLSCVYFSVLALIGEVPAVLGWIQLAMFASYLIGFFATAPTRTRPRRMKRLRTIYRSGYLVCGLAMVLAVLAGGRWFG